MLYDEELASIAPDFCAPSSTISCEEPREFLVVQRRYFEAARQRAIFSLPESWTFGNPKDYETHIQIRVALEAGMTFCNVKDALGGYLAPTVEGLAQRCVNAEAGSAKQAKLIEQLQDEIDELKSDLFLAKGRE
jgi:hypothetical protein